MTDTELLIRDCLESYAGEAEQADLVGAAKAQSRLAARGNTSGGRLGVGWFTRPWSGQRVLAFGMATVVIVGGLAFALGGNGSDSSNPGLTSYPGIQSAAPSVNTFNPVVRPGRGAKMLHSGAGGQSTVTTSAPGAVPAPQPKTVTYGKLQTSAPSTTTAPSGGVGATRVVKTGELDLTVPKDGVSPAIGKLGDLAKTFDGYVSQSQSATSNNSPSGEIVLRIPVQSFESAVTAAEKLGKVTSLQTNAADVTGKYVDLNARLAALRRTRQTYLTILGRARSIGSTLSVQQRVDDTQSQIEQLQGKLKVLRNQSSDATLSVSLNEPTPKLVNARRANHRSGISKAWHTSISRFARGFDAIVAALGPLLLAAIIISILALAGRFVFRRTRGLI